MKFRASFLVCLTFSLFGPHSLLAVSPTESEMKERDLWVEAKLGEKKGEPQREAGLVIILKHDRVQRNEHNGKLLAVGDTQYQRGLFCHAVSKISVRLPSPGKAFSAKAGILSALAGGGGAGSVRFSVDVGGDRAYHSDLYHGNMPALPVDVDLKGALSFTISISDGGDGIASDQACWAEAKVTLDNGDVLWLDELPAVAGIVGYDRQPFFSFVYDDKRSSEFLHTWKLERASRDLDEHRKEYTLTYRDPETNLVVRCVGVAWKEYPTVEWTIYFKNEGTSDTPILESIQAVDTNFERTSEGEFLLHHHNGDKMSVDSFAPLEAVLDPKKTLEFMPAGGRGTSFEWPYYALERPAENAGVIIVVGWPGQWKSQFIRDDGNGLRVVAGQQIIHATLRPGEEIRTPLMVFQFYEGYRYRAQNIWRRWMFEHNFPKDHGKPLSAKHGAACVWYFNFQCTQAGDIEFINTFAEKGLPLDYWWMDAGWYPGESWPQTGTWKPDPARFPDGIRAVSDTSRKHGGETIVWFEVERVQPGTWITDNHPEWVVGGAGGGLLKLHEPEAVEWVTNHVSKLITEEGIDVFRSDFNLDPLHFWRQEDAEDRQGMTENLYIQGYLKFWDGLRERHPGMLIDSCASGGRRDDLESMRRAIPLLRTDLENNPEAYQCATYGFFPWLPYSDATNWERFDDYYFRSCIAPFLQCNWDVRKDTFPAERARECVKEWRSVVDYYFGDFWPLTDYGTDNRIWMAWQFDRPDLDAGVVQAFRRGSSAFVSAEFKLTGLEPDATYVITDYDADAPTEMTGTALMEKGLFVTIQDKPGAALITYKKK